MGVKREKLSNDKNVGYQQVCPGCGHVVEVIVVPNEGKTFQITKAWLDRMLRIGNALKKRDVKTVTISYIEGKAGTNDEHDH